MKLLSATLIGVISGFLIYMIPAMLLEAEMISKLFVLTTFASGTAATLYIVLKGAQNTAEVWARGGLVWGAEWIVAAVVPIYVSWLVLKASRLLTLGAHARATVQFEAWITGVIGIGICLVMALMSFSLYAIVRRRRK